jgi:hypothetical protein
LLSFESVSVPLLTLEKPAPSALVTRPVKVKFTPLATSISRAAPPLTSVKPRFVVVVGPL